MASHCDGTYVSSYKREDGTKVKGYCRRNGAHDKLYLIKTLQDMLKKAISKMNTSVALLEKVEKLLDIRPTSMYDALHILCHYHNQCETELKKSKNQYRYYILIRDIQDIIYNIPLFHKSHQLVKLENGFLELENINSPVFTGLDNELKKIELEIKALLKQVDPLLDVIYNQRKLIQLKKLTAKSKRSLIQLRRLRRFIVYPQLLIRRLMNLLLLSRPVSMSKLITLMANEIDTLRMQRDSLKKQIILSIKLGKPTNESVSTIDQRLQSFETMLQDIQMHQKMHTSSSSSNEKLMEMNSKLDELLSQKDIAIKDSSTHINNLKTELERNKQLLDRIESLQKEKELLIERLSSISELEKNNSETNKKRIDELMEQLKSQLNDLSAKTNEQVNQNSRMTKLENELSAEKAKRVELESTLGELDTMKAKVSSLETQIKEKDDELHQLQEALRKTDSDKARESDNFSQLIKVLENQLQERPTADNIDALTKEIEALKQEHQSYINDLSSKIKLLQEENTHLNDQLLTLKREHETTSAKLKEAKISTSKIDDVTKRIKELESQLDKQKDDFSRKERDLTQQVNSREVNLESVTSDLDSKKIEVDRLKSEKERLHQNILEHLEKEAKLQDTINVLNDATSTLQQKIDSLTSNTKGQLDQLNQNHAVLDNEKKRLQEELDVTNSKKDKLISGLEEKLKQKQGENDTLTYSKNSYEQRIKANEEEIQILKSDKDKLINDLKNLNASHETKYNELTKQLENLNVANESHMDELKKLEQITNSYSPVKKEGEEKENDLTYLNASKVAELIKKLQDLITLNESKVNNLTVETQKLTKQLEDLTSSATSNEQLKIKLENNIEEKQSEIQALQLKNDQLTVLQLQCKTEHSELKMTLDKKIEELVSLNKAINDKDNELQELKNKYETNQLELKRISDENDKKQIQINELQAKLLELPKINKLTEETELLQSQLNQNNTEMTSHIESLRNELEGVKRKALSDHTELIAKIANHETELATKKREYEALQQEKNKSDEECNKNKKELENRLERQETEYSTKIKELEATIVSKDETIKDLNEKVEQCDKINTELERTKRYYDSVKSQLQSTYDEQSKNNQKAIELKKKLEDQSTLISDLQFNTSAKEKTNIELNSTLEKLQYELESKKKDLENVSKTMSESELEIAQLKDREADAKAKLEKVTQEKNKQDTLVEEVTKKLQNATDESEQKEARCNAKIVEAQKEADKTAEELSLSKKMLEQAINQINQAAAVLDQTAYKQLADNLRENIKNLSSGKYIEIGLENPVQTYSLSTLHVESLEEVYNRYKTIVNELVTVEDNYFKIVTSLSTFLNDVTLKQTAEDNLRIGNYTVRTLDNENSKKDNKNTFIIYSFMSTVLFQLAKTFVRLPTVIRLLSNLPENGYDSNSDNRKQLVNAMFVNVTDLLKNDTILQSGSKLLYNSFISMKETNPTRIDIVCYYLMKFCNQLLSTVNTTNTEYNNLLGSVSFFSIRVLEQLKGIYYAVNQSTVSILDEIVSKDGDKIKEFHNAINPVVTLVKIRMDGNQYINKRFRIQPITKEDSEKHIMHMEYCDFDYRKGYKEGDKGNHEYAANGFPFYDRMGNETCDGFGTGEDESIIPYNADMYYGPFTRIYTPDMSNNDIVNDISFVASIENKLRESKPVCIIGYGASGSGKTSTLVYYKPDDLTQPGEDGILSVLSNKLSDTYDRIKIKVYEFEANIKSEDPVKDYLIRKYPQEIDTVILNSRKQVNVYGDKIEYVKRKLSEQDAREQLNPSNINQTSFEYVISIVDGKQTWVKADLGRYTKKEINESEYNNLSEDQRAIINNKKYKIEVDPILDTIGKKIPMATEIVEFMDTKRSIAATANNPVSSRSHVIIFITYINSKQPEANTNLVLCDFAGVENKFDCTSASTLNKLGSIPIKGTDNKGMSEGIPFYEKETGAIKVNKYKDYVSANQNQLIQCAIDIDKKVSGNITWLLNELRNNPLPINDIIDPDTNVVVRKGAKTLEKEYQSRYPATEMVPPLEFLQKIKYLHTMKKTVIKKINQYNDQIQTKSGNSIFNNLRFTKYSDKDKQYYTTTHIKSITNSSKFLSDINNFNNFNVSVSKININMGDTNDFPNPLPNQDQYKFWIDFYSLDKQLYNSLNALDRLNVSIKDDNEAIIFLDKNLPQYLKSLTIEKNPPLNKEFMSWLNNLFTIFSSYGAELYQTYPDDQSRRQALQILQYAFEYGIIYNNDSPTDYLTVSDSLPMFMDGICEDRVKEGLYINQSLYELRMFISNLVQTNTKGSPPFIDQCAPLQCHPSYKRCFGINPYDPQQSGVNLISSSLAEQIKKVPHSDQITFCILCVINVSRTSANNPPVSPYINITSLMSEYERLLMVQDQYFMDRDQMKEYIKDSIDGRILTNSLQINKNVLDELINHKLLGPPLENTVVNQIRDLCTKLKTRKATEPDFFGQFKQLIDIIYNCNAITTVGTLEFTDTMAKFGSNSVTCTMKYTPITDTQVTTFLNNVNKFGVNVISSGLEKLVKRKLITGEDMKNQLKQFIIEEEEQKNPYNKPVVSKKQASTPRSKQEIMLTPDEINNKILVWLGKSYQQGRASFNSKFGNVNLQDPPTKDDIDKLKSVFTPYGTQNKGIFNQFISTQIQNGDKKTWIYPNRKNEYEPYSFDQKLRLWTVSNTQLL